MFSLSNVKMKYKLVIMLSFPLFGLIYFSAAGLSRDMNTQAEMAKLTQYSALAIKSSALVHELQKERGMSAGYLGAKGLKFRDEINDQRLITDKKYIELNTYLNSLEDNALSGGMKDTVDQNLALYKKIDSVREAVSSLNIETGKAIKYYTSLNSTFLSMVDEIVKISSDSNVTRLATGYSSFLQAKERAGIERAVLSNTFAAKGFGPNMYKRFAELVAEQKVYMSGFIALATNEEMTMYHNAMTGRYIEETERMRRVAFDHPDTPIEGIDAGYWFEMQTGKIESLLQLETKLGNLLYESAASLEAKTRIDVYVSALIVMLGFLVTIITAVIMLRNINHSLIAMTEQIEDIAAGDLTGDIEVNGSDEFAYVQRTMKAMKEELRGIITGVNQGAESVRLGTTEISQGHNDLSQRTEEQAASLEEAAASMEQMAESVKQNAKNAEQARESVLLAKDRAQQGALAVTNAIGAVTKIDDSSSKMGNIISVINEISFQTNLLALNAAVEAARAGEKGRGFAVVAREIRELAQRSAGSAKEINDLIKENIEDSRRGMELVEESGEMLGEIVGDIIQADKVVSDIAKSCLDQSSDIEQMNAMVMGLNAMTQQNAALVEETTANTRSMVDHVQELSCKVALFKLDNSMDKQQSHRNDAKPSDSKNYPAASVIPFEGHGKIKDMNVQVTQQKRASSSDWEDF